MEELKNLHLYKGDDINFHLFSDYPSRLNCELCHQIMTKPIQTECGCRYCRQCMDNYLKNGKAICPNCKDCIIEKSKLLDDKAIEIEIMNQMVKCSSEGCLHISPLKGLDKHLSECDYRVEQCDACKKSYIHSKQHEHIKNDCGVIVITCDKCGEEMSREELRTKHQDYESDSDNICSNWIRDCPYGCNSGELLNIRIHLAKCPNKPVECQFKGIGCIVKGSQFLLALHMKNDGNSHLELMMQQLIDQRKDNIEFRKLSNEKNKDLELKIEELHKINSTVNCELVGILKQLEKINTTLQPFISTQKGPTNSYKDIVVVNGQATWTIKNIREKMQVEKTIRSSEGNNSSQIVSEAFYVSRPGYLLSLKIYPNGDGRARNKSLSIFFVINRGEYDTELKWPFQSKVTLTLLSGNQSREDIVVHMKPDNNPGCYGRPLSSHNIGAGQPDFVTLTDIIDTDCFLHNGALKIRLSIYQLP